jgi:hypothetical protein
MKLFAVLVMNPKRLAMLWIGTSFLFLFCQKNTHFTHFDFIIRTSNTRSSSRISERSSAVGSRSDQSNLTGSAKSATTEKIDDLTPRDLGKKRSVPSSFNEGRNDSSVEDEDELLIFEMNRKPLEKYLREAEVVFASGLNKESLQDTAVLSLTLSRADLLKYLTLRRVNFSMRLSQKTLEATAKAHAKSNLNAKDSKKKIDKQDDNIEKPNDNAETHVSKEQMLPLEDLFDRKIKAMAEAMNKATKSEMEKVFLL